MNVPHPEPAPPGPPHPEAERLALAALPAELDDPAVAAHLVGCARCRAEVAELRRVVEFAREGGVGDALPAPPPHVWRGIATELGLPADRNGQVGHPAARSAGRVPADSGPADGGPADDGSADDAGEVDRPHRRRLRRVGVLVATAVLGVAAGLGIGRALNPPPPPAPVAGPVVRLTPVGDLDPAASGTVAMADAGGERKMVVQVQGVTNIGAGDHLEAWLMDATGTRLVPLGALDGGDGTFHATFALPDGLPLTTFDQVDVSAERWDGNPAHSTASVLRGAL